MAVIKEVNEDWFLFLDDDVRVGPQYLASQINCIAPLVGAIQGKKVSSSDDPSTWLPKRSYRGGTHATLIKTQLVKDIKFPNDLHVLEDQYLRTHIVENGMLWIFNRIAVFEHDNQERHDVDFQHGSGILALLDGTREGPYEAEF